MLQVDEPDGSFIQGVWSLLEFIKRRIRNDRAEDYRNYKLAGRSS